MKKAIIIFLAISILGFIGWLVYGAYSEKESSNRRKRQAPNVAVEISPVKKADILEIGNFTGSLKQKSLLLVAPKVSGRLKKLSVNVGDRLIPKQTIAVLEDDEFKQQFQQGLAYLEVAKANLEAAGDQIKSARLELLRVTSLHKKKLIATSTLDNAKTEYAAKLSAYRVAKAQLEEKKAALEVSRIRLSYTTITNNWSQDSPFLIVGQRFVDEGAMVGPTSPIVSVLDISSMVGVINVTEMDYYKIRPGQSAEITVDALPNRKFLAKVIRIAPVIKEKSREAEIELEIPNKDGFLKPGLFIRASLKFSKRKNSNVIPVSAIVKRDNQTGVFLVTADQKKVKFVKIQPGLTQNELIEVVSPQIKGSVVTLGQHLLEDGSGISIPENQKGLSQKTKQKSKKNKPDSKKP